LERRTHTEKSGRFAFHTSDEWAIEISLPVRRSVLSVQKNPFMVRAIELSSENLRSGRRGPFAAVVVRDGNIIAEGVNQLTSTNDPTAHAEVIAIREACKKLADFELKNCALYTSCEPCPMCLGAIYWARPARVYFVNTAEDASRIGFDDSLIHKEAAAFAT
jgi:guanine deaminase